ncbi:MAG: PrgI family protein, partial [Clostridia bacterium]|nr:PrgI family protein [Clostridia bacterium]
MEIKINREIRNYTESMFFGLSPRQFIFSVLALGVAVLLYFLFRSCVGAETVSWMCILGAVPFAAMGFITYHGMSAEEFFWAWMRSELLEHRFLRPEPVNNFYYAALRQTIEAKEKEEYKTHAQNR